MGSRAIKGMRELDGVIFGESMDSMARLLKSVFPWLLIGLLSIKRVDGSPMHAPEDLEQPPPRLTEQLCLDLPAELANCTICYDPFCQITYPEAIASFDHLITSVLIAENASVHYGSDELTRSQLSPETNGPNCPPVDIPSGEAEYGCMFVPKFGPDGCVSCFSYACLRCNTTADLTAVSNNNRSVDLDMLTNDAEPTKPHPLLQPTRCPPIAPDSTDKSEPDSQDCIYVPQRGLDGCVRSFNLVCPQNSTMTLTTSTEQYSTHQPKCPPVKPPPNKTANGCTYAEHLDERGCVISYDMICSTPLTAEIYPPPPPSIKGPKPKMEYGKINNHHHNQYQSMSNYDWRSMLGDSYKGSSTKDARKFRPRASVAVPSSGKFVPCKKQSDCFQYREPKEWCSAAIYNSSTYAWTDKSCYCANDTEKRTCLIERVNLRTKSIEWTFCSPKKEFTCL